VRRLLFPHLAVFAAAAVALRVAVVPAEVCPPVDARSARASVAAAAAWLERGVRPDGRYTYGFDRERDVISADYNDTRHAGVMMSLYRVAAAWHDRRALAAGDDGLRFVRANVLARDGWVAFAERGDDPTIGASALLAAGLVYRRDATGDRSHDALIRGLARFLVAQQQRDGSVLGWWSRQLSAPLPREYAKWGTGETLWALALVDRRFPHEGWGRAAGRLAAYTATRRDDVEGYFMTLPDHWAAYALAELGPGALGPVEVAYARELAGAFGLESRAEAQSGPRGLRRVFRGKLASGAGLGTIGEGLAQLRRLSREDPRLADLSGPLDTRYRCTAGRIVHRQERVGGRYERGAWFSEDDDTQMDDQQHPLSALLPLTG
jgi:hypothetical protein